MLGRRKSPFNLYLTKDVVCCSTCLFSFFQTVWIWYSRKSENIKIVKSNFYSLKCIILHFYIVCISFASLEIAITPHRYRGCISRNKRKISSYLFSNKATWICTYSTFYIFTCTLVCYARLHPTSVMRRIWSRRRSGTLKSSGSIRNFDPEEF